MSEQQTEKKDLVPELLEKRNLSMADKRYLIKAATGYEDFFGEIKDHAFQANQQILEMADIEDTPENRVGKAFWEAKISDDIDSRYDETFTKLVDAYIEERELTTTQIKDIIRLGQIVYDIMNLRNQTLSEVDQQLVKEAEELVGYELKEQKEASAEEAEFSETTTFDA